MKISHGVLMAVIFFLLPIFTSMAEGESMSGGKKLNDRQKSIVSIAAFTASGDTMNLRKSLNTGLDAGLTVNEIKEILVQMYAYAGFPRSLNGIATFMVVLDERKANGINDETGPDAGPPPDDFDRDEYGAKVRAKLAGWDVIPPPGGYQLFAPVIDTFLKEHLFADIFVRDILNHRERELATIAALANMTGTEGQLRFHFGAAMNTGLSEAQMHSFITTFADRVDKRNAADAEEVLNRVLNGRD